MSSRSKRAIHAVVLAALAATFTSAPAGAAPPAVDRAALRHDTFAKQYRNPGGAQPAGTPVTLRIRTSVGNGDTHTLRVYRYDAATGDTTPSDMPMSFAYKRVVDGTTYDFYEVTVNSAGPAILFYKFRVTAGSDEAWYSDDPRYGGDELRFGGLGRAYGNEPFPSFQLTYYAPAFTTPDWLRDAAVYQIFPDRFRNGDPTNDYCRTGSTVGCPAFYGGSAQATLHPTWNELVEDPRQPGGVFNRDFFGGDLEGIAQKLDYIKGLGFNTLYLNPIFRARSNHRYDTDNYLRVDESLGGEEALDALVAALDQRNMRLILDGVLNHASSDSRYFDRYHRYPGVIGACESLSSQYRDWFQFRNSNVPCDGDDYESFFGIDTLPQFDTSNPEVRDFFYRSPTHGVLGQWYRRGADGWRFDFAEGPPPDFWRDLRPFAKAERPNGPLIAESFSDATRFLLGDQFDSTVNNRFRRNALGFARQRDLFDSAGFVDAMSPSEFDHALAASREAYPPQVTAVLVNVLDHHDSNRALAILTEKDDQGLTEAKQRLRLAALFQFTYLGAPMVLYGDEAAIDAPSLADGPNGPVSDPYSRAPYPWEDETGDVDTYGPPDHAMIDYYELLGSLRKAHPALRRGSFTPLLIGDVSPPTDDDSSYAFARSEGDDAAVVVMNKGNVENKPSVRVRDYFADGATLRDALTGQTMKVSGGRVVLTLPARRGALLLEVG